MKSIMLFGEMLLRLTPSNHQLFIQANQLNMVYGGSEANIAVALSNWGEKTSYSTCVPDNNIGLAAIMQLRQFGVNTDFVIRKGQKMGLYFVEQGHSIRPTEVTYDRQNSAFMDSVPSDYQLEEMLDQAKWLHVSGISLGVSKQARETTMALVKLAHKKGIKVSFDFNYRTKLWSIEEAREEFKEILPYVNVCFGSYMDALTLRQEKRKVNSFDEKIELLKWLQKEYNLDQIFMTEREVLDDNVQKLSCAVITATEQHKLGPVRVNVLDRIGTGDSFVAGVLYGLANSYSLQETLDFALSSFALKHTIVGDFQIASKQAVQDFDINGKHVVIKR
ncbi:MAG: PfkB family carbohydrate kinase [Lysinibacillus sp.]